MSKEAFFDVVREIKRRIRRGEVYQVNFSLPFYFDACAKDLLAIYQSMRINNRSPFMGAVVTDDWWLLSGSPERLFSLNDGVVTARPIAGTKKRGSSQQEDDLLMAELRECPKENAEHAMLVDLMRNDLNQVAKACTVKVDEDRSVEFYSHVMHLVSEVSCETSAGLEEIFRAVLPGGTITGAPKDSVMKTIAELEGTPRGPYTGSLGYISSGFGVDFNILIRSVCGAHDRGWINTGAGIVIDSDENDEWKEVHSKAMAIKEILANRVVAKPLRETARADVERSVDTAVTPRYDTKPKNILFIENHDSFSFNIIDALRALGARVEVARVLANQHSHVVIGPGPGNPSTLPDLWQLIDQVVKRGLPLLGICLGHQAIGHYFGSNIKRVPEPVHGKSHPVIHGGRGLFDGLSSPTTFARYHSLAIEQAPQGFVVDAHTKDDCIMAIRHQDLPIFGVQFHPESYLSHCGQVILRNFLQG